MEDLNAPQVTLLVAVLALVGGLLGWLGRGMAFVVKRRLTESPKHEEATYINVLADLGGKLRAHGMTMEDVRQLESIIRDPSISSSKSTLRIVEEVADEAREPDAFHSNVAMKARTHAEYNVADAKLNQSLLDLKLLMREREIEALATAQDSWTAYRAALEECSRREYEGGTHSSLASLFAGLAETERRAEEIRSQIVERTGR